MDENTEEENYNYRIVEYKNLYYVEKKYHKEDYTLYWEKFAYLDETFDIMTGIPYSSIEDAEKAIEKDKANNPPDKIIKYL